MSRCPASPSVEMHSLGRSETASHSERGGTSEGRGAHRRVYSHNRISSPWRSDKGSSSGTSTPLSLICRRHRRRRRWGQLSDTQLAGGSERGEVRFRAALVVEGGELVVDTYRVATGLLLDEEGGFGRGAACGRQRVARYGEVCSRDTRRHNIGVQDYIRRARRAPDDRPENRGARQPWVRRRFFEAGSPAPFLPKEI